MKWILAISLLCSSHVSASNHERLASLKTITRFVFGSCNDQRDQQPLWEDMAKTRPDFFLWGGDNVYSDWHDKNELHIAFERQNKNPDYQKFKAQVPIMGLWDDHDYGGNDSNGHFKDKVINQQHFLNFMEEPLESPRRKQAGIYTSYSFDKVKLILLDNRYFKDLEVTSPLLGETQWQWLEAELKNSTAKIHFIASGLSVLSPILPFVRDGWNAYPEERDRLLKLVEKYQTKGVVFLTGDMHFSSIFRRRGHLEFLASGMTHTAPRATWWYVGRRYETTFFGLNYGVVDLEWENDSPILSLAIRNAHGQEFHRRKFRLQNNRWVLI